MFGNSIGELDSDIPTLMSFGEGRAELLMNVMKGCCFHQVVSYQLSVSAFTHKATRPMTEN
jgi:hypothetical protein